MTKKQDLNTLSELSARLHTLAEQKRVLTEYLQSTKSRYFSFTDITTNTETADFDGVKDISFTVNISLFQDYIDAELNALNKEFVETNRLFQEKAQTIGL